MSRRDDFTQVAESTPFDNSDNGFDSDNVQEAIEEIGASASPGFGFGRSGNLPNGTWLYRIGSVISNRSGVTVFITNAIISQIACSTENLNTYDVTVYEHDGDELNLTAITTVSVVNSRKAIFSLAAPVTTNKQLAVRITSGSAKNLGVDLQLKGSI